MNKVIALLCLLNCVFTAFSQNNAFMLRDIRLPQQFNQQIINFLEQDSAGLLWFVTNNGLYRFDGTDIVHLGPESTPAIPHAEITTLFADKQQNLWIGSKDGLTRLNLRNWTTTEIKTAPRLPELSYNMKTVSQGMNGTIYVGSQDGKLFRVVEDSLALICDINRAMPELYELPNITFIEEPYPNQLWLGSTNGKLVCIRIKEDGSYSAPSFYGLDHFKNEQIVDAAFGPKGQCLISVPKHGIYLLDTRTGTFRKYQGKYGDLGKNGQVFLAPFNKNEALLLTNTPSIGKQKLLIYNFLKDTIIEQNLNFPAYLKDNHITWFSHSGSMILLSLNEHLMELAASKSPFTALLAEPKSLNSIRAIYKQPGGALYIGSYKDGFMMLDERTKEKQVISRKYVYSILPWGKDSLLLSTEGDGLLWYEPLKHRLTKLDIPRSKTKGLPMGTYLTFLLRHDKQHVLVGTYERLYMVNPNKKSAYSIRGDSLFRTRILGLLKRRENYLIATEKGILNWNSQTDSISQFWINDDVAERPKKIGVYGMITVGDHIWAGTDGKGILILDKHGEVRDSIGRADGLAANIIFTLTATKKYVLAGTKNGLSVINIQSDKIKNYSTLDQLPANEFNSAAIYRDEDTAYFGTINGIVHFNASQLDDFVTRRVFNAFYITDLSITNHKGLIKNYYALPYHHENEIYIPARTQYFSIDFGSMGENTQALNYYYRLQEGDKWNELGSSRKISFVGMSPGQYHLQIAAQLPDGNWTDTLLSVPLIVSAAYYQTIWFKFLIGIVVLLLGWWILKYRERQVKKERSLRLKIAGDLHDEVGSTLAGISMQADMLLNGHDAHRMDYLQNIADNGRLAVQTMGDIVWSIDARNDDSISLFQRMERHGHKFFSASDISMIFHNEEFNEKLHMPQRVRQNVMLIYKEALTNIIKHAAASRVDVYIASINKGFKLVIMDDGKGLASGNQGAVVPFIGGHGLRNMQMRAEDIGAELEFPAVETGFKVVLIMNL